MIDFHTHILPGIDDGSRDIDMTEQMLAMEAAQGVSHIYATPHFYAHRTSVQAFIDRRGRALAQVRQLLETRPDLPGVTPGAEVYYFAGIGRAEHISELCVEGSDILLLEMPFTQWHSSVITDIWDLLKRQSLRVVLAHIERYEQLQRDRMTWDRVLDLPVSLQINCEDITCSGSLLRRNPRHRLCMELLAKRDDIIIGSDCHNTTSRRPDIAAARQVIERKLGADRLAQIDRYTEQLLGSKC